MKKWRRMMAAGVCIAAFSAMAIGSGTSGTDETRKIDTTLAETSAQKTADQTETAGTESDAESEAETTAQETVPATSISEQILLDQDGIIITAKEYVRDAFFGDGIKLLIENNTEKNICVSCSNLIVNDFMFSDLLYADVAAGKKANETVYLSYTEMKRIGWDKIGKVEIYFHIYEADSYEDIIGSAYACIQTSDYENVDYSAVPEGVELYNADGIRISGISLAEDTLLGLTSDIYLYCENNTGRNICISVQDMSVNGFMVTPLFYQDVLNGKKAVDSIMLSTSELEENDITDIGEIELSFHIYDSDTYQVLKDTDPIGFIIE